MPYDPYGADERRDSRYMDDDEYRRMREAGLPAALSYCAGAFMSAVSRQGCCLLWRCLPSIIELGTERTHERVCRQPVKNSSLYTTHQGSHTAISGSGEP